MRAMKIHEIGDAIVTFPFRTGGKWLRNGTKVGHEQLARMGTNNRNSLIDKGYLYTIPKALMGAIPMAAPITGAERHIVSRGFGRFDVIEGHKINDAPLTKEAATALIKAG